ncbi:MAG: hypothetical protein AAF799_33340 [Myxococcota bacterium]
MAQSLTYQAMLVTEFEYRRSRNSGYSLRAFARDLAMPPSTLNEVLNQRKGISSARARKLARRLGLSHDLAEVFVLSARAQHARAAVDRSAAEAELAALASRGGDRRPKTTTIVGWVTEAVLKLYERRGTQLSVETTAAELKVPTFTVQFALRFLTRLGFLEDAPPSRAFLAYLGKGRRLNVDYEQLLRRATAATREPGSHDVFVHEPLLLDARGVKKAQQLIERCLEDVKRLSRTSRRATLYYLTSQLFQAEFKTTTKGEPR